MQDSGLYNELDEKQMVRYSDIVKGSITKYEGLKDEAEKNTYTSIQSSANEDEDAPNDKYEHLEGESEKNIYRGILKTDTPKYVSDKDIDNKVGEDEDGYLKPGSRNSQESGISLDKNKESVDPVTNDIGNSQFTSNVHADGYINLVTNNTSSTQVNGVSSEFPVQQTLRNEADEANQEHTHETEKDHPNYISVIDDNGEGKKETGNRASRNSQESNILPKDTHTKDNIQREEDGYMDPVSNNAGSSTQGSQHACNAYDNGYLNLFGTNSNYEQKCDDDGYLEPTEEHEYETATTSETGDSGIPDDDIGSCHTADTELNDEETEVPHEYTQPYEFSNPGFTIARQSYMAPVTRTHRLVMENDKDVEDGRRNKSSEHCAVSQDDDYLSLNIDHNYTKLN